MRVCFSRGRATEACLCGSRTDAARPTRIPWWQVAVVRSRWSSTFYHVLIDVLPRVGLVTALLPRFAMACITAEDAAASEARRKEIEQIKREREKLEAEEKAEEQKEGRKEEQKEGQKEEHGSGTLV